MTRGEAEREPTTERPEQAVSVERLGYRFPLGAIFGALAFVVGYAVTLLLTRVAGGLTGSQDPIGLAGLVFYGAHFVFGTIAWPTGVQSVNAVADVSSTIPTFVYHLVPVVVLTTSSYIFVTRSGRRDGLTPGAGTRVGMAIMLGYLPLVVVGTQLFRTTVYHANPFGVVSWQVDLGSALVLAGLVYPLAFGALGGYLAVRYPNERLTKQTQPNPLGTPTPDEERSRTIDQVPKNSD